MGHLSKARWFVPLRRAYNALRRRVHMNGRLQRRASVSGARPSVLVLGVYLAGRRHTAGHLAGRFEAAEHYDVTQRWACIGTPGGEDLADASLQRVTTLHLREPVPKFIVLNRLLALEDWHAFDYLVFSDDDIVVPRGFLDAYLDYQAEFDLALAQPARTRNSYADRKFCLQEQRFRGRRTRYVEIGPLFSVRRDLAPLILPFDESSPMGWGYDYVWPVIAERAGLGLGIIDATPVDHSLRPQAVTYSASDSALIMNRYLQDNPHLSKQDAFRILRTY